MDQEKIDRINQFARRVKAGETLTPAELAEREIALKERQLDADIVEPDGARHRLPKKK